MGWFVVFPYLIHFLVFHFASSTLSLCNPHDLSSLLLFNNSFPAIYNTSSDPFDDDYYPYSVYPKTASWKNGTDCCEWDGVTCDTISGHVIGLNLSCSNLQGQFHPNTTLFHLTHLQLLDLSSNGFSGDIPSTISHLSKLVSLDLSNNCIMRLDPSTWNKLILNASDIRELHLDGIDMSSIRESSLSLLVNLSSSLISLSLRYTRLQGNLPTDILCLPNLQHLQLSKNENLSGQLPKSNWSTPLRHLSLSDISFSGEIPNSIGHLRFLNTLSCFDCKFDGLIPLSLWNLTQLTYLVLAFNNLTGEISPLVSNLKHLTLLELSSNSLEGQLPPSLFNSTQPFKLDLSYNNLVGPIPSKITKLSKISYLVLAFNLLNGTIPRWCYSLPSLLELHLNDNQLTGSISEFSTYSMEILILSNNKLQGNFPNSIYEFQNLQLLKLSSNNLSGLVDFQQFSKLKTLCYLDLSHNTFLSFNFNNVDLILPSLEILFLSSCNINTFPKFLARLQYLYELDLSNNKIHGNIPKWLYERDIYYIDLSFNQLNGDLQIPAHFIGYFSVSNNNLSGDIPSTICNASFLVILNLSHNNFSGVIPQCSGNFPALSVLDLQRNNLHGEIPRSFCEGNALETIKLNGNRLEGPLPQSLAHCKYLEVLDVGDNNIDDIFPSWLETLQELQVLSLRLNKFHGTFTCSSTKHPFPKLRIFDVSNNRFSGPLPTSCINNFQGMIVVNDSQTGLKYMSNHGVNDSLPFYSGLYNDSVVVIWKGESVELVRVLTSFTTIDLSNNMFEGEIPKVIGELHSLIGLNLSHNRINGTIPQFLSNLTSLEWLDLSWNKLKGEIPMTLTNLHFLSILNLSENRLEGMIPTGGQFNTFENVSYEGNPMLCGFPLSKSCNKGEGQPPQSTVHHEEDSLFGWKVVVVGYASGVVFGVLLGYSVFFTGKPQWLARLVGAMPNRRVRRTNNRAHANRRGMN